MVVERYGTRCYSYERDGKWAPYAESCDHSGWRHGESYGEVLAWTERGFKVADPDGDRVTSVSREGDYEDGGTIWHDMVLTKLASYPNTFYHYHPRQFLIEDVVTDEEVDAAIQSIMNTRPKEAS